MSTPVERLYERPGKLLTSNGNLSPHGIKNWTIPAWAGRMADGRTYNTCPSAGVCATGKLCYARTGAYMWPTTLESHQRKLAYVLDDLGGWAKQMSAEISKLRPRTDVDCPTCKASPFPIKIRIHDAGDFFSDAYTSAWTTIADEHPDVFFYAYTKEVDRCRRLIEPGGRANFGLVYSLGGTQDGLIDRGVDRYCEVFPTSKALELAGFYDQEACDLLAVVGPKPVGMAVNRNPGVMKKLGNDTFGGKQLVADIEGLAKLVRRMDRRANV